MILVRKNVYKDVCLFENVFKFVRCFKMCVFVLKIASIFVWNGASNYNESTYSNVFLVHFLFLWYCCLTIDLVTKPIFGCKGRAWVIVKPWLVMLQNILAFWGTKIIFVRQPWIASSRDYDLILVCFAKILHMRNMAIFVLGNQVEKP